MATLLLTCEHGGAGVPREWARLFASREAQDALATHRGYDLGALTLARALSRSLGAPLLDVTATRLLVDTNRSATNRAVFSEFSRRLEPDVRREVLARFHAPHRERVRALVAAQAPVVHVAVHSFTPQLDGETRNADVGLLYDPRRAPEARLAATWKRALADWRVRMNYPYRGTSDGLTTWLRREFAAGAYAGIELEVNQGLLAGNGRFPASLVRALAAALEL